MVRTFLYEGLNDELGEGIRLYVDKEVYEIRKDFVVSGTEGNYTLLMRTDNEFDRNEKSYQNFLQLAKKIFGENTNISRNEFVAKMKWSTHSEHFEFDNGRIKVNFEGEEKDTNIIGTDKAVQSKLGKYKAAGYLAGVGGTAVLFGEMGGVSLSSLLSTTALNMFIIGGAFGCLIPGTFLAVGAAYLYKRRLSGKAKKMLYGKSLDVIDGMEDKMRALNELRVEKCYD